MLRRAIAIVLLSGAALVFAFRFEPPPSGPIDAEGEIATDVPEIVTTTTVAPTTTTHAVAVTTTAPTPPELGPGVQVVESPLVRMSRGYVQVEITVLDWYLADVDMTVVPSESMRAREISLAAHEVLQAEAVEMQSHRLHNVSGATETSRAWMYALKLALIDAGIVIPPP